MLAMILLKFDNLMLMGFEGPTWVLLEDILTWTLEMIEQKRVEAVSIYSQFGNLEGPSDDDEWEEYSDFFPPWSLTVHSEVMVDRAISAWDKLIATIGSRISGFDEDDYFSYSLESINACGNNSKFIKQFLQRARIPKQIKFVAPGLRLPLDKELPDQPFKYVDPSFRRPYDTTEHEYKWYPFLWLHADKVLPATEGKYTGYP
jgi:hypothetical protein